jgi:hypothetical protein
MDQEKPVEEDIVTATLTDLPLTNAQAEGAKAGAGNVTLIGPPETAELKKVGESGLIYSGESG